ncbi:MAG TPA: UDP-3-O-(3-hydroxymyristoyl)glucosamine N-acyltransferase [Steroidobacteraceae bacterium]|nr:UDP-3-O-(3-hydroxymyristoyl)glucosamine N-acyltransferase [Steroidobacteraceae bacterium]
MAVSLGELAVRFGCELRGNPDALVERIGTLANADSHSVAYLSESRNRRELTATRAAVVVLERAAADACPTAALICNNPRATFARITSLLHPAPHHPPGVHPSAIVSPTARVDSSAHIGALAIVGDRTVIGPRVHVGRRCVVEEDVILDEDVYLVASVTLCHGVTIGARTIIQPGVVIGGDGFGFAPEQGKWVKVPQVGSVRIGADVEIGANTTIDRGAIEDTVVEEGVKLDNQIQLGHNVRVGAHTVIAGCTGISGSTVIGKHCIIGGACGIAGHLTIGDGVVITGFGMVSRSLAGPGVYSSGLPITESKIWRRQVARVRNLESLVQRVKKLEGAAADEQDEDDDRPDHT